MGFEDVLRAKQEFARKFPDPGQAGTHETQPGAGLNAEAGFFAPHEMSYSAAPAQNYAPPGVVEAGFRRPEDADPQAEQDYLRDWYHNQNGQPSRGIVNR